MDRNTPTLGPTSHVSTKIPDFIFNKRCFWVSTQIENPFTPILRIHPIEMKARMRVKNILVRLVNPVSWDH